MAVLNEEQTMLRDMAQEWVRNEKPVTAFRKTRNAGEPYDREAFASMVEMGWTGVIIPEAQGGSGLGYLSLGLVLEEAGRNLVATPLLSSCLEAVSALLLAGTEAQKDLWLPLLASGETIGALALDEGPRHDPTKVDTIATKTADGWTISGSKAFVAEGQEAGLLIVSAKTEAGVALFLVPGKAAGVTRTVRHLTDARGHADIVLAGVSLPAEALLGPEDGAALIDKVLDRARAGVAAEMLGLAEQAFETTLDYLKVRVQFGQVLSTFQALQHRCAHLFTRIELLRSGVESALGAIDADRADIAEQVSMTKAAACEVLNLASREMIQLHGGIGMTDEHDAGFYIKRARVLEAQWGNAAFHRDRYARLSGF
jgi:alkylation response protein AidB-like acyl-CoA dehydrogenase